MSTAVQPDLPSHDLARITGTQPRALSYLPAGLDDSVPRAFALPTLDVSAPERVPVGKEFTLIASLAREPPQRRVRFELVAAGLPPIHVDSDTNGRATVSLPHAVTYELTAVIDADDTRVARTAIRLKSAPRAVSAVELRLTGPARVFAGDAVRVETTLVSDRPLSKLPVHYALRSAQATRESNGEGSETWPDLEAGDYTLHASVLLGDHESASAVTQFSVQLIELTAIIPASSWHEDEPALFSMRTNLDSSLIEHSGFVVESSSGASPLPLTSQGGSARAMLDRGEYQVRATLTYRGQQHSSPPVRFTVLTPVGLPWAKLKSWLALLGALLLTAAVIAGLRKRKRKRSRARESTAAISPGIHLRLQPGSTQMQCSDFAVHFRLELRGLADRGVLRVRTHSTDNYGGRNG